MKPTNTIPDSPQPRTAISAEAFERFLTGECTEQESAQVAEVLATDPVLALLDQGVRRSESSDLDSNPDLLWTRFRSSSWYQQERASIPLPTPRRSSLRRWWPAVATGAAVIAAFAVIAPMASVWNSDRIVTQREFNTTTGQQATIQLGDGSHIVLAPETHLQLSTNQNGEQRADLTGHARFVVNHRAKNSFVVQSGAITTRVLGTTFDVRHYAGDADVQVSVTEGKVATTGPGGSFVLAHGMAARLTDSVSTLISTDDLATPTEWTDGKLVFKNMPVKTMLSSLERWYGVRFQLADSTLATQRISTVLLIQRPVETLNILQDMLDVSISKDGDVITLRPAGARRPLRRSTEPVSLTPQRGIGK